MSGFSDIIKQVAKGAAEDVSKKNGAPGYATDAIGGVADIVMDGVLGSSRNGVGPGINDIAKGVGVSATRDVLNKSKAPGALQTLGNGVVNEGLNVVFPGDPYNNRNGGAYRVADNDRLPPVPLPGSSNSPVWRNPDSPQSPSGGSQRPSSGNKTVTSSSNETGTKNYVNQGLGEVNSQLTNQKIDSLLTYALTDAFIAVDAINQGLDGYNLESNPVIVGFAERQLGISITGVRNDSNQALIKALAAYQKDQGLKETGVLNKETLLTLAINPVKGDSTNSIFRLGERGKYSFGLRMETDLAHSLINEMNRGRVGSYPSIDQKIIKDFKIDETVNDFNVAVEAINDKTQLFRPTSSNIRCAQRQLGLKKVDGVFDSITRNALRNYEKSKGRPPVGALSREVMDLLLQSPVESNKHYFYVSKEGTKVAVDISLRE